ncbi:hypothetical protein SD074_02680 [Prolixibacter sp. SD074]|nr:hypothetical protein SD074_02680 [Prolixibacter sp. SD074]
MPGIQTLFTIQNALGEFPNLRHKKKDRRASILSNLTKPIKLTKSKPMNKNLLQIYAEKHVCVLSYF